MGLINPILFNAIDRVNPVEFLDELYLPKARVLKIL